MSIRRSLSLRLYQVGIGFAGVMASLALTGVGCSETTPKSGTGPAASSSTDIGVDAGSSWADASVPANITATQACTRFMRALCERKNECGLANDDCAKAVANCPDSLFSEGTTREPESTWKCAFEMRQRSCQDVYLGINPPCATAGTKKVGESCIAAAQCESLACTGAGTRCGKCVQRNPKGADCSAMPVCEPGLTCDTGATNTCIDLPPKTFDGIVSTGLELGKACDGTHVCVAAAYCRYSDEAGGICSPRLGEGEPCTTSDSCVAGTYCFLQGNTCRKIPLVGERCGVDAAYVMSIWCEDSAYCDPASTLCKARPASGEPCAANDISGAILCASNAVCDTTVTPPTCKALAGPAETCVEDAGCQPGLKCLCNGAACDKRTCGVLRDIGENCANPGEVCNVVSTCQGGTCAPNPSQGLYAALCSG